MSKHYVVNYAMLVSLFCADSDGNLVRRINVSHSKAGDKPGTVGTDGYVRISIVGKIYYAHRRPTGAGQMSGGGWWPKRNGTSRGQNNPLRKRSNPDQVVQMSIKNWFLMPKCKKVGLFA